MSTRRILRGLLAAALLALSALVLALVFAVNTGRLNLSPVLSGSMRPTFQPGDLVAARPVQVSSLHVGDVIAFVPPGQNRREMHRIVRLTRKADGTTAIVTRGDANHGRNDPWGVITLRGTKAYRLAAVIPKLGWVSQLPRNIILPASLVVAGLLLLSSGFTSLRRKSGEGPSEDGQQSAAPSEDGQQSAAVTTI